MAQWLRLGAGWLDMDKVGSVAEGDDGALTLRQGIGPDGPARALDPDDAATVRAYLALAIGGARATPDALDMAGTVGADPVPDAPKFDRSRPTQGYNRGG